MHVLLRRLIFYRALFENIITDWGLYRHAFLHREALRISHQPPKHAKLSAHKESTEGGRANTLGYPGDTPDWFGHTRVPSEYIKYTLQTHRWNIQQNY